MDKWANKKIFLFTATGKFINSIGKQGNGPGEYLTINDAVVSDEKVSVLSSSGNTKIFDYDYNGQFLLSKEFDIPTTYAFEFNPKSNDYYFYVGNNPNADGRLLIYNNSERKVSKAYFEPNKKLPPSEGKTFYRSRNNKFFFWEALGNTVYQIKDNEEIRSLFCFDWGREKELNSLSIGEFSKVMAKEEVYLLKSIIIKDDYRLFLIVHMHPKFPPEALYILKNNDSIHYFKIKDNSYFKISPAQCINDKDQMLFLVEPQNKNFKNDIRYKELDDYMFCLKINIEELIHLIQKL